MIYLKRTDSKDWDFKVFFKTVNEIQQGDPTQQIAPSNNYYHHWSYIILVYEKFDPIAFLVMNPHENSSAKIISTYVVPKFRKRGIAKMMLHEIELWAKEKDFKSISVIISSNNYSGLILGIKIGFKILVNCPNLNQSGAEICLQKGF
jgi:putative acetyltransferase